MHGQNTMKVQRMYPFFLSKAQENIEGPYMKHIFVFVVYKSKILPH